MRILASLLFALPFLAPSAPAQQDGDLRSRREDRRLERREQELAEAEARRDAAFAALDADYRACQKAWDGERTAEQLPDVIRAWLAARDATSADWPRQRRLLQEDPGATFHAWWNDALYLHSAAAAEWAAAVAELEEAFLEVEKLRHPERFAEGYDTTPRGMVLIPEGDYPIGPHFGRVAGFDDAEERREVRVDGFYLDRTEVSCAAYAEFVRAQPQGLRNQHLPLDWDLAPDGTPVFAGPDEAPVVGVTWGAANAYARWAGKRLPTELEWEAAAAGTEGRAYPREAGFDAQRMNVNATRLRGVRPPQEFAEDRTPLGILAMGGNAAEWTGDLWLAPLEAGKRARSLDAPRAGAEAVVRGGSFLATAEGCRNTYRTLYPAVGRAYRHVGFRCAQDLP